MRLLFTILFFSLGFVFGCQQAENSKASPTPQVPVLEGTASGGGGGYGNESGQEILELAQNELAGMISQANPDLFEHLNEKNKNAQQELLRLIQSLEQKPTKDVVRDGVRLKFNYDESDPYHPVIYATQLFFDSTASIPLDFEKWENLRNYIQDTQVKILHEAMHILGYGRTKATDGEARELARRVYNSLWSDTLYCTSEEIQDERYLYIVNLTSGFGNRLKLGKNGTGFGENVKAVDKFITGGDEKILDDSRLRITNGAHYLSPYNYSSADPFREKVVTSFRLLNNFEICYYAIEKPPLLGVNCTLGFSKIKWEGKALRLEQKGPLVYNDGTYGNMDIVTQEKESLAYLKENETNLFSGNIQSKTEDGTVLKHALTCRRIKTVIKTEQLGKKI
jgi:hypothetical protein